MNKIAVEVFKEVSATDKLEVNLDKEKFKSIISNVLKQNIEDEKVLDQSVNDMMDTLVLKKKLAEQKGFVL